MAHTCLVRAWHSPMSTPSCAAAGMEMKSGSARGNTRLFHGVAAIAAQVVLQPRSSVAVGRRTCRTRCSATVTPGPQPLLVSTTLDRAWPAQRAAVLAVGTANPTHCVPQDEYTDWYFGVTKSDHLAKLKAKMKKICLNSGIKRRYFHHTAETFRDHPEFVDRALPSLDSRQGLLGSAVPELAATAARKAMAEWGRPARDVTHLIFATNSGARMPGADLQLALLLGLRPSVQRTMMYLTGCSSGSAALRVAKDVAENNPGARVLVACADLTLILFRTPREDRPDTLIMQALFGDGAGAAIVGAGCKNGSSERSSMERPLFEMVSASQTVISGSEKDASGQLGEDGLVFCPSPKMPGLVRKHVEKALIEAFRPLGFNGSWNDLFWALHPGGPAILDSVQDALALAPGKLAASRHVLAEYGNMSGVSVIFVMDELRRRGDAPPGSHGVMLGLGPGVTVETMVLRRV